MSDIPEWYIYDRLRESGLPWSETIERGELLAHHDNTFYYTCTVRLAIDGQTFDGVGAHDHAKLEWAVKGAHTSAFKDAAKWAGITMSVWKSGTGTNGAARTTPAAQGTAAASTGPNYGKCPTHGVALEHKSGVGRTSNKPYDMVACPDRSCRFILPDIERKKIEDAFAAKAKPAGTAPVNEDDDYLNSLAGADPAA